MIPPPCRCGRPRHVKRGRSGKLKLWRYCETCSPIAMLEARRRNGRMSKGGGAVDWTKDPCRLCGRYPLGVTNQTGICRRCQRKHFNGETRKLIVKAA